MPEQLGRTQIGNQNFTSNGPHIPRQSATLYSCASIQHPFSVFQRFPNWQSQKRSQNSPYTKNARTRALGITTGGTNQLSIGPLHYYVPGDKSQGTNPRGVPWENLSLIPSLLAQIGLSI